MLNTVKNTFNFLLLNKYYQKTSRIKAHISIFKKHNYFSLIKKLKKEVSSDITELFALIYIVIENELKIKTHDFQLLAALLMCDGYVIDMKTGEGKTIAAIYTAVYLAKKGQVHVITVNDVLAERDYKYSLPVMKKFNIISGVNSNSCDKEALFESAVVYSSSTEIVFDYLRSLQNGKKMILNHVIIDEIDYVLIDNANSKCSISEFSKRDNRIALFRKATEICNLLIGVEVHKDYLQEGRPGENVQDYDYTYSFHNQSIEFSECGVKKIMDCYGIDIYSDSTFLGALLYCIEAKNFFIKDADYKIINGKLNIINKENGRLLQDCTYSDEIQLALEVKEKCILSGEKSDSDNIMYQIFYKKYRFLTGMSGTAYLSRKEFKLIFDKDVSPIPVQRKIKRVDMPDIILKTKDQKYEKLTELIELYSKRKNPIVIVCESDLHSEKVYKMLEAMYPVNLLNNNTSLNEEKYIKLAGKKENILVTTNMVGRGTDIVLNEEVNKDGGLTVIVMTRYTNKRIDAQVMGRSGRQGNSGISQFIVSLEDDIFKYIDKGYTKRFTDLGDEAFYSLKIQTKLRKLIAFTQNVISGQQLDSRLREFSFESIVDTMKTYYSGSYHIDKFICGIIDRASDNSEFSEKYQGFGDRISKLILKELYKYLFKNVWVDFFTFYTNLKQDINLRAIDKNLIYTEFINEASREMNKIEKELEDAVINAFTTVKLLDDFNSSFVNNLNEANI